MIERIPSPRLPSPITMGMVILLFTVLGIGGVLVGYDSGVLTRFYANLWVGFLSTFATVALALGIYIQAAQNRELVENTKSQTTIIRESEVMPHVREDLVKNRLNFDQNRPWSTEIKVEFAGKTTGWIQHPPETIGSHWEVRIRGGEILKKLDLQEWVEDEGVLYLRYESITGGKYLFEFYIRMHVLESGEFAITSIDEVSRQLPWDTGNADS